METAPPKNELPEQVVNTPAETKPKKEKKPATPAQQAARDKGLQAMMAKRRELAEKQKEKKEEVKKAKKVVEDKILKEDLRFASINDIESLRKNDIDSLKKEVAELRGMLSTKQQQEKEKPAPKAERIVERVYEKVPTPTQPAKLTGHALLDKLFN